MRCLSFVFCGLWLAAGVGCEKASAPEARTAAETLPANLIAATVPAGAEDVATVKKSAKDGQSVVIKGRVGGQKEPLAADRAIMTVSDLSLPTCDKTPMDTCATPWDSCCEPASEIAARSIAVQVIGTDGRPLKAGLGGVAGIGPGKQVVVAGTLRSLPGAPGTFFIAAQQIFVSAPADK